MPFCVFVFSLLNISDLCGIVEELAGQAAHAGRPCRGEHDLIIMTINTNSDNNNKYY